MKEWYFRLFNSKLFTQPWAQEQVGAKNEWVNEWMFILWTSLNHCYPDLQNGFD